jgi:hypothetical protein
LTSASLREQPDNHKIVEQQRIDNPGIKHTGGIIEVFVEVPFFNILYWSQKNKEVWLVSIFTLA